MSEQSLDDSARQAAKAFADDQSFFEDLVCQYEAELVGYASSLIKDREEAKDLVQQMWEKACRSAGGVQEAKNVRAWLYRVLINTIRDWLRRKKARGLPVPLEPDMALTYPVDPEERDNGTAADRARKFLQDILPLLPEHHRKILEVRLNTGGDYSQMSILLQLPRKAIGSRVQAAFNAIRKLGVEPPALAVALAWLTCEPKKASSAENPSLFLLSLDDGIEDRMRVKVRDRLWAELQDILNGKKREVTLHRANYASDESFFQHLERCIRDLIPWILRRILFVLGATVTKKEFRNSVGNPKFLWYCSMLEMAALEKGQFAYAASAKFLVLYLSRFPYKHPYYPEKFTTAERCGGADLGIVELWEIYRGEKCTHQVPWRKFQRLEKTIHDTLRTTRQSLDI